MDRDKALDTLVDWFGDKPFGIKHIPDENIPVIAGLVGLRTDATVGGMRKHLGKRLTALARDAYKCSSGDNAGAKLEIKGACEKIDPSPEVYWIE